MLHIFTYGAGDITLFDHLKTSADFSGLNINYVERAKWNGFFDKIKIMYDVIQNLPENDIVCFVDGFDVLATGDNNEILDKFLEFNCDLLISTEANSFPEKYRFKYDHGDVKTCFKFANSGGFIGYKRALMDVYKWKSLEEIAEICKVGSDQAYFIEYYLAHAATKNIKLDTRGRIFLSLYGIKWTDIEFTDGRVFNKVLGENPCFLHFNGHTYYSQKKVNILPVINDKLKLSLESGQTQNLNEHSQDFDANYFRREQTNPKY